MGGPSHQREQKERRALTGTTTTTTFHQQAMIDLQLENGGRFAKDTIVSGTEASVRYPAGPAWTRNEVGLEPPLGVAIDAMEPCGEAFEIERSLGGSVVSSSTADPPELATLSQAPTSVLPSDVVEQLGGVANPSARLAQILPKIAVPIPAPPKRRRV
jgi:hypothetical protein